MRQLSLILFTLFFAFIGKAQVYHINEDFNAGALPSGWSTVAITGTHVWEFGLDGSGDHPGNNNLNGTAMAYFDDSQHLFSSLLERTYLETPVFDNSLDSITLLEFDYNFRESSPTDTFKVEVFDGTAWQLVFFETTDNCGSYINCTNFPHAKIDISPYKNASCRVRFTYFDGNDWGWYVALDNVKISSRNGRDIGISRIENLRSQCNLQTNDSMIVTIANPGGKTHAGFQVAYRINGGAEVVETVNQSILPFDTLLYTFQTKLIFSGPGSYNLEVYTKLPGDTITDNDTAAINIQQYISYTLPYFESFESSAGNWITYGTNNSWNRGIPTASVIDTAAHGLYIFGTNTAGNYNNRENAYLESPCLDFSALSDDPILSFFLYYHTEFAWDRLDVQYSIDNGDTWIRHNGSSNAKNWYNYFSGSNRYWSGNSQQWLKVFTLLNDLAGESQVKLRFRYTTDPANNSRDGIGIDQIFIRERESKDLSVEQLVYPNSAAQSECGYDIENIVIEVGNRGLDTAHSFILSYRVDGGTIVSDTIHTALAPQTNHLYSFTVPYDFSIIKNYRIDVWAEITGDGFSPNDSNLNNNIINTSVGAARIPYIQNFDSWTSGTVFSNTNDSIGDSWTRSSSTNSNYSWRVSDGNNLSTAFPSGDHTTGGNGGKFLYTEASGGAFGDVATLTSPCIDLPAFGRVSMGFWFHRFGAQINSPIFIDVYDGVQWVQGVDQVSTFQVTGASPWLYKVVDLSAFVRRKIKVRFRAISGGCCAGDMAIDDISIEVLIDQDAEVLSLQNTYNCYLDTMSSVVAIIFNNGYDTIFPNTLNVHYQARGQAIVSENVSAMILPGDTLNYSFSSQNQLIFGDTISVSAWTTLANDSNVYNDTVTAFIRHLNIEDFESEDSLDQSIASTSRNWSILSLGANVDWRIMEGPHPNANSGPIADHTLGVARLGNYLSLDNSNGTAQITSSCINLNNAVNTSISFWYYMYGANIDRLLLQAFDGVNWITLDSIVGQQQQSKNQPWRQRIVPLTQMTLQNKNIMIRFVGSNNGTAGVIALDDIRFNATRGQDLALIAYEYLQPNQCPNPNAMLALKLRNEGNKALDFTRDTAFFNTSFLNPNLLLFSDTIADNTLNGGLPLASGDSIVFLMDSIDISREKNYFLLTSLNQTNDGSITNNAISLSFRVDFPDQEDFVIQPPDYCLNEQVNIDLNRVTERSNWELQNGLTWSSISSLADSSINFSIPEQANIRVEFCAGYYSDTLQIRATDLNRLAFNDSLTIRCGDTASFSLYNAFNLGSDVMYRWYDSSQLIAVADTFDYKGLPVNVGMAFQEMLRVEAIELMETDSFALFSPQNWVTANGSLNRTVMLNVNEELVFESVDVYSKSSGDLRLIIEDQAQSFVQLDSIYTLVSGLNRLNMDQYLAIDNYQLRIESSGTTISGLVHESSGQVQYYSIDSNLSIQFSGGDYDYYYNPRYKNWCSSGLVSVNLFADCLVGIDEQDAFSSVSIYPNPTTGRVTIDLGDHKAVQIEVLNQVGQIVRKRQTNGNSRIQVELGKEAGLYFIKITDESSVMLKKVIKQ